MARKNESPQKAAMREMMRSYLKDNDISIKDGTDQPGNRLAFAYPIIINQFTCDLL